MSYAVSKAILGAIKVIIMAVLVVLVPLDLLRLGPVVC